MAAHPAPLTPHGAPASLVELLRWRAAVQPGEPALHFLSDGTTEKARLTYAELDQQARAFGGWLQAQGLAGQRVLLLFPPGLEFVTAFFGCLYAGAVAVPSYPPRQNRTFDRLQGLIADAQVAGVLCPASIWSMLERLLAPAPGRDAPPLRWLDPAALPDGAADGWRDPKAWAGTVAFLQYTSGSTGQPKGVVLTHGNQLHNLALIADAFQHTPESRGAFWLPLYHDMGLIGGVLQPLYVGRPSLLMSPVTFFTRPFSWLQAISHFRATTSGGPNFAYDLCVRKVTAEQKQQLDLSCWELAFTGAEPIRAETLDRFAEAFAPCGFRRSAFYSCYGLAEATLMVSAGRKGVEPARLTVRKADLEQNRVVPAGPNDLAVDAAGRPVVQTIVGCGVPRPGLTAHVVSPESLTRCEPDQVGEVWVAGPSVARGYWNRPQETRETFGAKLADAGAGPFLRTGDLGFEHDGELFICGRLKDLIIIRGRNCYPQDIEWTVDRAHPGLRLGAGAAFSVEIDDEERLVVVQEAEHRLQDAEPVLWAVRQAVAEQHEIQVYAVVLIKPGSLPKSSSGKVQRRATRSAFLQGKLDVLAEWRHAGPDDEPVSGLTREALLAAPAAQRPALLEAYLRRQLAQALRVDPAQIEPTKPLTTLGLDSLTTVELKNGIEASLGVSVPISSLLQGPSVIQLAQQIADRLTSRTVPADDEQLRELMQKLDQMSDSEVRAILDGERQWN
jgi:acyl-CoA synthetase (AMP-forming)/AMP-acid ligase II/acyl carrier protein